VGDQWLIRAELKSRFPNKPWVDVLSKADLLEPVWRQVGQHEQRQVSQLNNQHLQQEQQEKEKDKQEGQEEEGQMLQAHGEEEAQQQPDLAWQPGSVADAGGTNDGTSVSSAVVVVVQTAEHFAAALPAAVRVSAVTEAGLPQLQQALVHMLQSPEAAAEAAVGAEMLTGSAGESGMLLLPKA
jgi:nucleolar GTP-binding protein